MAPNVIVSAIKWIWYGCLILVFLKEIYGYHLYIVTTLLEKSDPLRLEHKIIFYSWSHQ